MRLIVAFFGLLFAGILVGNAMSPIVDGPGRYARMSRVAKKNRNTVRSKSNKIMRRASRIKKQNSPVEQKDPLLESIKGIDAQLSALKVKRLDLEFRKHALLTEFAQKQTAFAAILPSVENKPQQSIFLAMSSKSMDDFVYSSVMLKYLRDYFMRRNREYSNLRNSIHSTDLELKNCAQYETELNALRNVKLKALSEQSGNVSERGVHN
jgi:hypothetical protein